MRNLKLPKTVLDGAKLRADLTEIARGHRGQDSAARAAVLALLKQTLANGHAFAQQNLLDGKIKGDKCAAYLSALMDEIIRALADYTIVHELRLANPTAEEKVAVVAVGGYGRAKLAPHSDIDLLFVLPYKRNAASEQFVEFILYMLWDLGLKVGHATRSINDCVVQAQEDMTVRTAMLEARLVWGEAPLYADFRKAFERRVMRGTSRAFVAAKLEERDKRHDQAGRSRYLVEPNLKEGKGGLRDLNTLFWIGKYCYAVDRLNELVDAGVLNADELSLFRKCEQFLWTVRCHLHFLAGRAEERLSFDVQTELARRMKVRASAGLNPVEKLMRQYFLVAKNIGDLTAIFCAALEEEQTKKGRLSRLPALFRREKHVHGFVIETGRLNAKRKDIFQRDPVNIIRVFALADRYGLDIHPDTMRLLTRVLKLVDRNLQKSEEANKLFLDILTSKKDPERALRRMNEAGVLGRFIPDFGRIVAMMQFNMYHHYTADEHLLRAIGILAEIDSRAVEETMQLPTHLMTTTINRRVVYLAVLLHDIAKGRPEDHSLAGAKIARRLGPRLGFTADETALTAWLVEHHLVMSDVAQRRDLGDAKTIEDFVAFVQTVEQLQHLFVLTVVDIQAVGPGVWNGWKDQLLRELYFEAEAVLTGGGSMANRRLRLQSARDALAATITDKSEDWISAYLRRHQDAYWLNFDLETQKRHVGLLQQAEQQPMIIDFNYDKTRGVTALTFIGTDHPGLFARLTGACAIAGLNILDARITTTRDGFAVDTLFVRDPDVEGPLGSAREGRLRKTISAVLMGELHPPEHFAAHRTSRKLHAFNVSPRVRIDNDLSDQATVIEVTGLDRPGLLHALTRDLFNQNVSITAARVATFGERAVDVFYVTDLVGHKIINPSKRARLVARLKDIIADPVAGASPARRGERVA